MKEKRYKVIFKYLVKKQRVIYSKCDQLEDTFSSFRNASKVLVNNGYSPIYLSEESKDSKKHTICFYLERELDEVFAFIKEF